MTDGTWSLLASIVGVLIGLSIIGIVLLWSRKEENRKYYIVWSPHTKGLVAGYDGVREKNVADMAESLPDHIVMVLDRKEDLRG